MVFNSLTFAVFFVIVWGATYALRNRVGARNVMLLAASYLFYGWWDWRFLSLLWISSVFDYICARVIERETAPGRRKVLLAVSMTLNLGLLCAFKYFNFFVDSAATALTSLGLSANVSTLHIVLPVGISFYTFQTMSYVIDVYRRDLPAERNLLTFALFVAFFPQLVAGPIERATRLLPQIRQPNPVTLPRVYSGALLIGWGLFKKVVLADNAALLVDAVFNSANPTGGAALLGVYGFAVQVYCDFSGYSDIARGTARTMGFELMRNFNLPYFATSPSDFWQRWHISLSTWLRDYLYIPLGGNRKGPARTYFNLMLTMTLGGLWHGAAWTFVLWGVFHGALLCAHRALKPWMDRHLTPRTPVQAGVWRVVRVVVFFHLVCFGYLLFRAQSVGQVGQMMAAVAGDLSIDSATLGPHLIAGFIACALLLLVVHLAQAVSRDTVSFFRLPVPVRALVYAGGILGFIFFGEYGGSSFIYFQF